MENLAVLHENAAGWLNIKSALSAKKDLLKGFCQQFDAIHSRDKKAQLESEIKALEKMENRITKRYFKELTNILSHEMQNN